MNGNEALEERREASTASLALVVGILIGSALAFVLATAPFSALLGAGQGALPAMFHGLAAFLYLFVGTIGLYLAWRLWTGRIRAFADLQLLATVSATFALLAIVSATGSTSSTAPRTRRARGLTSWPRRRWFTRSFSSSRSSSPCSPCP